MRIKQLFCKQVVLSQVQLVIIILSTILATLSISSIFILDKDINTYKYAYIDFDNNIGLTYWCRNKKCAINDSLVIPVKEYIDIRKDNKYEKRNN